MNSSTQTMRAMQAETLQVERATDVELVARAVAGREDCFESLVHRYQRPLVSYIYRMTGDYEAALDLTQEVFIKVYGALDKYRSEFKFSTWIYRISHNIAVDHLRKNGGREVSIERDAETDGASPFERHIISSAPTPEQWSERNERRGEIEQVVGNLPAAYRELIVLRHGHDFSYEEIAEVTGLPLGTVKNRIFRAREAMRKQLEEMGITGV